MGPESNDWYPYKKKKRATVTEKAMERWEAEIRMSQVKPRNPKDSSDKLRAKHKLTAYITLLPQVEYV